MDTRAAVVVARLRRTLRVSHHGARARRAAAGADSTDRVGVRDGVGRGIRLLLAVSHRGAAPDAFAGDGFGAWGLRFLYDADPPYNCFPSIHVAHSVVSALACFRVHQRLGLLTIACAALVAISTLFTKQHYVADVVAGAGLALLADGVCIHPWGRDQIPESDRRVAPVLAVCASAMAAAGVAVFFAAYVISKE